MSSVSLRTPSVVWAGRITRQSCCVSRAQILHAAREIFKARASLGKRMSNLVPVHFDNLLYFFVLKTKWRFESVHFFTTPSALECFKDVGMIFKV